MGLKKMKLISRTSLILSIPFFLGCATRRVNKGKYVADIKERIETERKAPGAQITYFPPTYAYPMSSPDGPVLKSGARRNLQIRKDSVIYGKNGSSATVFYEPDGHIRGFVMDCPEILEKTSEERKSDILYREKQSERSWSKEMANIIGRWLAIICISCCALVCFYKFLVAMIKK